MKSRLEIDMPDRNGLNLDLIIDANRRSRGQRGDAYFKSFSAQGESL